MAFRSISNDYDITTEGELGAILQNFDPDMIFDVLFELGKRYNLKKYIKKNAPQGRWGKYIVGSPQSLGRDMFKELKALKDKNINGEIRITDENPCFSPENRKASIKQ